MTNATTEKGAKGATAATTNEASEYSRADFNRRFAQIKSEVSTIVYDSEKARPLWSKDKAEAVAKREAVMKAFESFLQMIEGIKKEA